MSSLQILIVEDEPDGADLVRRMLKATGMQATVAGNAETALAYLQEAPDAYSAAIVDLALPEMDGFELMQIIRGTPQLSRLPLVAMTAFHTPELKARALDGGFDAYFAKPLDTTLFVQSLERVVRQGR